MIKKIAIAQLNTTVGDLGGNTAKIIESIKKAKGLGADLIIFPELTVTGYPPEDLLLKPDFIEANRDKLNEIIAETKGIAAIVGFVGNDRKGLYNSAAFSRG